MEKLLSGKNALITGAGENIGRSIALEMAKQGANIYFTEIDQQRKTRLERELQHYDITFQGFLSDVSQTEDINALCRSLEQEQVYIDLLIHNVGLDTDAGEIGVEDLETWRQVFDTNILGPIHLTNQITQSMITRRTVGSILFITSIHQWIRRRRPSYSASKAGLGMIVNELAIDLAPHQIRVNGIAPGTVREKPDGQPYPSHHVPLHHQAIPPRYIGRAAVYLSSDYFSRHTTGTILKIDAGLSLINYLDD